MPREIVVLQVGQCGNQIGQKLWDVLYQEHLAHPEFEEAREALFYESRESRPTLAGPKAASSSSASPSSSSSSNNLVARCVAVDMEEGVLSAMVRGPLGALFDRTHFVSDVSGAGNNWAVGHMEFGDQYLDSISDSVRRMVEKCDSLQTFFVLHSLSGGTGSGLGTRMLGMLQEEFPHVFRFCSVVMPSENSTDVVTAPYNSCFALRELVEHADCVLPLDNEALAHAVDRATTGNSSKAGGGGSAAAAAAMGSGPIPPSLKKGSYSVAEPTKNNRLPYDSMNAIVAQMLSNVTCSMRFPGALNMDINEITTNLVPYPRLHLISSAIAPLSMHTKSLTGAKQLDGMFAACCERDYQLVVLPDAGKSHTTLATAYIARGASITVGDLTRNVARAKERIKMVHWNRDGFKTALCGVAPLGHPHSLLSLTNSCAIADKVRSMQDRFRKLYSVKSHVHHYEQYLELPYFDATMEVLGQMVDDYDFLNTAPAPTSMPRSMKDLVVF